MVFCTDMLYTLVAGVLTLEICSKCMLGGSVISFLACSCCRISQCTVEKLSFACVEMSITPCSPERPNDHFLPPHPHYAHTRSTYHPTVSGYSTKTTKHRPFVTWCALALCMYTPRAMASTAPKHTSMTTPHASKSSNQHPPP